MKTDPLHQRLTCNVHFTNDQRRQVRRGERIETPSIHLGHTVPSVEFVVEIQAHLNRDKDVFKAQHSLFYKDKIPLTYT